MGDLFVGICSVRFVEQIRKAVNVNWREQDLISVSYFSL